MLVCKNTVRTKAQLSIHFAQDDQHTTTDLFTTITTSAIDIARFDIEHGHTFNFLIIF
jgi:hypothetical protein